MVGIWIFALLAILLPAAVGAQQPPAVVINEVAWMGTPLERVDSRQEWRYEWLELYGATETSTSLEGWVVELYRGEELYFEIPLAGTVLAKGYFLVGASDKIPEIDISYDNLGGKFLNEGMRVVLKDGLGGTIDEVDAAGGWPAGNNESKRTMEKTKDAWQTSAKTGGTPGAKNSKGFEEPPPETAFFQNKKDLGGSSLSLFSNPAILAALPVAVLSALLVLVLRRKLSQGAETFDVHQE